MATAALFSGSVDPAPVPARGHDKLMVESPFNGDALAEPLNGFSDRKFIMIAANFKISIRLTRF